MFYDKIYITLCIYVILNSNFLQLEAASDYQERSKIRSALRKIKKSRGEVSDTNKNSGYKRRGHQVTYNILHAVLPQT